MGQDQTCNADPSQSSLAGKCVNNGTSCECNPGSTKNFTGKCAAAGASTGPTTFPEYLEGLWLIGWSGGLDHYSWVRLSVDPLAARFRAKPSDAKSVTGYYGCDGKGSWNMTAKPRTIFLNLPAGCPTGAAAPQQALTFGDSAPPNTYPVGAILRVTFVTDAPSQQQLTGFRFPDDTCDLDLTTCADPFVN